MLAILTRARKSLSAFAVIVAAMALAACEPIAFDTAGGPAPRLDAGEAVPVALLVPASSGSDAVLAQSLENAARLAIADLQGVNVDLRVYNTAGQPGQAAAVAQRAVDEGAKIILGPVYAGTANAASVAVADDGVNVLAFSNNSAIAGGNLFVLGNTFENTADRLVRYAARQGRDDILIVHGRDTAEEIGRAAIGQAIAGSGARLAGVTPFELSQQGVVAAAPQIAAQVESSGADAVFLTSGTSGALSFLAQLLPENGVDPAEVQYIGLQRWDIPSSALALPGLQGGWFALPDPALAASFRSRYQARYGSAPHPIAGLAYDGIAAIGALARSGRGSALSRGALTQGSGFVGVNGVFRFRPDGTNQRGLAVAEIRNNEVVVIDPAPRSFGGAGF